MNLRTRMDKVINSTYSNTTGIIVKKEGTIICENYYHGYAATDTVHIASVTKSILSALIGIAIDKGSIPSIDQKILDYFPDYHVKKGETTLQQITIRDMLTMTVPYKFKTEPYTSYFSSMNWVQTSLDLLGGRGRIGDFRYAPVIGPDILSGILVQATGQSILDFANENLFVPMDIQVPENIIFHNKEEQLAFYKDTKRTGWVADPQGINTAGWGLNLTPLDLAKIGQLYLQHGSWKNSQLVPAKWILDSTTRHSNYKKLGYGYLWWVIDNNKHIYAALGQGGNTIYVNQEKNLIIAIASLFVKEYKDSIKLIKNYLEPLFS